MRALGARSTPPPSPPMAGGPEDTPGRQQFRQERPVEFWVREAERAELGERGPLTSTERADLQRARAEAEEANARLRAQQGF